jgi:hypothetical protein
VPPHPFLILRVTITRVVSSRYSTASKAINRGTYESKAEVHEVPQTSHGTPRPSQCSELSCLLANSTTVALVHDVRAPGSGMRPCALAFRRGGQSHAWAHAAPLSRAQRASGESPERVMRYSVGNGEEEGGRRLCSAARIASRGTMPSGLRKAFRPCST